MTRDLFNNIKALPTLVPAVRLTGSSPYNGTTIDTQGAESCMIDVNYGTPGVTLGSGVTIEFDLQESVDGTTWTAAADSVLTSAVGVANGAANTGCIAFLSTGVVAAGYVSVGYTGTARYLRVVEIHAGTQATGTPTAVKIDLSNYAYRPVRGNAT